MNKPVSNKLNQVSGKIVHAAFQVHSELGPGLLENVYEKCLCYELKKVGLKIEEQVLIPVKYKNMVFDSALRIDVLVENQIILELKSVEALLPVHKAQMMTYLKLTGHRLGLLINFNVPLLKEGIQRIII
ncbi:MAG TPA: GxxExxY protein [bacterium]|nr:GxxExxY protein [bacterium]